MNWVTQIPIWEKSSFFFFKQNQKKNPIPASAKNYDKIFIRAEWQTILPAESRQRPCWIRPSVSLSSDWRREMTPAALDHIATNCSQTDAPTGTWCIDFLRRICWARNWTRPTWTAKTRCPRSKSHGELVRRWAGPARRPAPVFGSCWCFCGLVCPMRLERERHGQFCDYEELLRFQVE